MDNLISISTLSGNLNISTRTLRYYEDVGLISSIRLPDKQQRFYDVFTIERVNQIRLLRKMEISVKDIIRIYQDADITDIIDVFTQKIKAIDENIATLTELRSIIEEFRGELIKMGITNVNALPALMDITGENRPENQSYHVNIFDRLEMISAKRADGGVVLRYVNLRPMRVLTSRYKDNHDKIEELTENEYNAEYKRLVGDGYKLYANEAFEGHSRTYMGGSESIITKKIPDDCVNDSPFVDYILEGWFIAVAGLDHWDDIQQWLNNSDYYELDDTAAGGNRDWVYGAGLTGEISSLMDRRGFELWDLLLPIRPKQGAAEKYKMIEESKTAEEIINAVSESSQIPINFDEDIIVCGRITRLDTEGELAITNSKSDAMISTNKQFSIPVRVDATVKLDTNNLFIRFHKGDLIFYDIGEGRGDENILFKDISTNHNYWIKDKRRFPVNEYADVTWILEKDFMAIIINGETIHYGVNYPYFNADCGFDSIKVGVPKNANLSIRSLKVTSLL